MKTVCSIDQCAGCMACVDLCPKSAITIVDDIRAYNAVIDETMCIACGACYRVCQKNDNPALQPQQKWYQGWAASEVIRNHGSSGGVATALALSFVQNAGVVCSCLLENGEFIFQLADTEDAVMHFSGSKYVKSNPKGCYKKIKELLKSDKKVLFIGLPCQVAAVKKYVGKDLTENLFTIDLICHGTPSPKLLDKFLQESGYTLQKQQDITFRKKILFRLAVQDKTLVPSPLKDPYTLSFINGISYTENCYNCYYAKADRVSDITLGDSWSSDLDLTEQQKGISLILCQTKKGADLVEHCNLTLFPVDLNTAIAGNDQLQHPSPKPKQRKLFFGGLSAGRHFQTMVAKCYPKQYYKGKIKQLLIALKTQRK